MLAAVARWWRAGSQRHGAVGRWRAGGRRQGAAGRWREAAGHWLRRDRPASVVVRLWFGLAAFVLLIAAAGVLVFSGISQQERAVHGVVEELHPLEVANLEMRAHFASSQSMLRAYIITSEHRYLNIYQREHAGLGAAVSRAEQLATGRDLAEVKRQARASAAWFSRAAGMLNLPVRSPALTRATNRAFASARSFYQANSWLSARLVRVSDQRITTGEQAVDSAAAVAGILACVAALLGVVAATATIRGISRPLRGLVRVLRRLTAGDRAARAVPAGPAEIQEVATSLNALAEESERLRRQEAETSQHRAMARAAGLRIREHLLVEDLVNEARLAIEENLDTDAVYLHVMQDGMLGMPVGHESDWVLPPSFLEEMRGDPEAVLRDLLKRQASLVVQDMSGADGSKVPARIRRELQAAGIASQVLVPFGSGPELLGLIAAARFGQPRPWSQPEIDALESIAADVGRGLHHARLYEAENRLVGELRAVDQTKSDFLATVSHELRTPLTSIAGYVEIMREGDAGAVSPVQARMLETVHRNTARLRHLIEDVLTLSKIESGAFKSSRQPVSLGEVIRAAVTALQPAAAKKDLAVTIEEADPGLIVSGDPGQLDRLMMNLLSNSVKFTPAGGAVAIHATRNGGMAVLRISDTGIGIPAADQKDICTRFFRASNAVDLSIPGTGLGLAIASTIVANHGGELDVRSRQGNGTTVTVRIPMLAAEGGARQVTGLPVADGGVPA
jgi:two-component system phosphate regulon sensor histidine kinase PhoR